MLSVYLICLLENKCEIIFTTAARRNENDPNKEDKPKNENDTKEEDGLKNEDDHKTEEDLKNEDYQDMKITSKMKTTKKKRKRPKK